MEVRGMEALCTDDAGTLRCDGQCQVVWVAILSGQVLAMGKDLQVRIDRSSIDLHLVGFAGVGGRWEWEWELKGARTRPRVWGCMELGL